MEKKLTRIPGEAVLGGVAAGMSHYFGLDRTIIRVLWVVALLLPVPPTFFWTAVIYIILWAALPEGTSGETTPTSYAGNSPGEPGEFQSTSSTTQRPFFSNSPSDPDRSVKIIGVVLLGVGAILLLDELPYWYQIREYVWPVALIAAGAFLLLRQRDKEQYTSSVTPPPPADPFPPVEPDPVPYRPFDGPAAPASIDPDAPADPDGETDEGGEYPQIK